MVDGQGRTHKSHEFNYCLAFTLDCSLEIDATCTLPRPCGSYLVSQNFNLHLTKKLQSLQGSDSLPDLCPWWTSVRAQIAFARFGGAVGYSQLWAGIVAMRSGCRIVECISLQLTRSWGST